MISPWIVAAWCLGAYLIGGLPVGWLLVRRKRYGLDLRKFGTGNIGTSNVYRHAGIDIAIIVGPLQFVQGFAPVIASRLLGLPISASMLIGVCAVAGNGWPVYMKFNGGRGVAVATGAVAALSIAGLIALLMCFAWGAIRGRIAMAVLVGFVILPVVAYFFAGSSGWILGSGCLAILALLLLRRLEGLPRDARVYGHFWRRVYQRLVFDERPGPAAHGPAHRPGRGHDAASGTRRSPRTGTTTRGLARIAASSPVAIRCVMTASVSPGSMTTGGCTTSRYFPLWRQQSTGITGTLATRASQAAAVLNSTWPPQKSTVTVSPRSGMSLRIAANLPRRTARINPRAALDDTSTSRSAFRRDHAVILVTRSGPTGAITAVTRSPDANPQLAATSQLPKCASANTPPPCSSTAACACSSPYARKYRCIACAGTPYCHTKSTEVRA